MATLSYIDQIINESDYSGYTFQYPPLFSWEALFPDEILSGWEKTLAKNEHTSHLGLYIHIPFCTQRCTFCRYFSLALQHENQLSDYMTALSHEMSAFKDIFLGKKLSTIYIGGGTPSLLSLDQLKFLFGSIRLNFSTDALEQTVFEGSSDYLTYEKLAFLKENGVNRLTLGVQTLDDRVLKETNRFQNNEEFFRCYDEARKAGISYINVDLMVGLPGQSTDSVVMTLEKVIELKPDMIHCHPFFPSKFSSFSRDGKKLNEADLKRRKLLAELTLKIKKKHGYKETPYDADGLTSEAINVQLADAIRYNSSYLGLGAGAVSHATGMLRYGNTNQVERYIKDHLKGNFSLVHGRNLTEEDEMIYFITASLRYGFVSKSQFQNMFGCDIKQVFEDEIVYLNEMKKIKEEGDGYYSLMSGYDEYAVFSKVFYNLERLKPHFKYYEKS